jgi:hypothetical protein
MTHRELEAPPKRVRTDVSPVVVAMAALLMAATGVLIELKPVNLATGADTLYIGLAIAAGAAVLALGVRARLWLRAFTLGVVALCVFNFIQTSHVLDQQRDQLKLRLDKLSSDVSDELPH